MGKNSRKRRRENYVWSREHNNSPSYSHRDSGFFQEYDSEEPPRSRRRLNEDYGYRPHFRPRDESHLDNFQCFPPMQKYDLETRAGRSDQEPRDLGMRLGNNFSPSFHGSDFRPRISDRQRGDDRRPRQNWQNWRGGRSDRFTRRGDYPDPNRRGIRVVEQSRHDKSPDKQGRNRDRQCFQDKSPDQEIHAEDLTRRLGSTSRQGLPSKDRPPRNFSNRPPQATLSRDGQDGSSLLEPQERNFGGRHGDQQPAREILRFQRALSKLNRGDPNAIATFLHSRTKELVEFLKFSNDTESITNMISLLSKMAQQDSCQSMKRSVYKALVDLNLFDGDQVIAKLKESLNRARNNQRVPSFDLTLMNDLVVVVADAAKSKGYTAEEANLLKSMYLVRDIVRRCSSQPEGDLSKVQSLLETMDEAATKISTVTAQSVDMNDFEILPGSDEVLQDRMIDLAPHSPKEPFSSSLDYLKYMFRIFREDFVTPLCSGVREYAERRRQGRRPQSERLQDVRVFRDVIFHSMRPVNRSGIVWRVQLDMVNTRRHLIMGGAFKHGSLLCLSMDDFQTLFFAEVVQADAKSLKEGLVDIRILDERIKDDIGLLLNNMFVILESTAFFTAYNFPLRSMRNMARAIKEDGETIPMSKYLVECQSLPNPPSYLHRDTMMDLTCLQQASDYVHAFVAKNHHPEEDLSDSEGASDIFDEDFGQQKIPVLQEEQWPSCESLGLDASQREALRLAVCGEVALVQGPPGTGKTTMGVKLAQLLLANQRLWREKEQRRPMLLLSYTNHALDQFLQLLLKTPEMRFAYSTDIVRVGGGCSVEALQRFTLKEQRETLRVRHDEAYHLINQRFRQATINFNVNSQSFAQLKSGLAHEEDLKGCMRPWHYNWLVQRFMERPGNGTAMVAWLELKRLAREAPQNQRPGNRQEDDDFFNENLEENTRRMVDGYDDVLENDLPKKLNTLGMAVDQRILQLHHPDPFWKGVDLPTRHRILHGIRQQMNSNEKMSEEEELHILNPWRLPLNDRWRLYRLWHCRLMVRLGRNLGPAINEVRETTERLVEADARKDLEILSQAKVVAMTTTGAARCSELLQDVAPPVVLVEEAAEIPEQHVLAALTPRCRHLVLIGDHCQLRPKPNAHDLARTFHTDVSMFERLVCAGVRHCTLSVQHRMRPEISRLMVPHFYPKLQDHSSVMSYPHVRGMKEDLFFLDHSHPETKREGSTSTCNHFEVDFITGLYRHLRLQGYNVSDITILATYMDQVRLIRKSVAKVESEDPLLRSRRTTITVPRPGGFPVMKPAGDNGVRVTSVDNFQGEENKIILLSLVRSNSERSIGHLAKPNRTCVALSRAQEGMYVVGNFSLLRRCSAVWRQLCLAAEGQHQLGKSLPLVCHRHRDNVTEVSSAEDFGKVPDGGCHLPCDFRRPCGHACHRFCHRDDPDHMSPCTKPCIQTCPKGHACPKPCGEMCGPCEQKVHKMLPRCGHVQPVPCYVEAGSFFCEEECKKMLACGHKCREICSARCTPPESCKALVMVERECGHNTQVPCKDRNGDCPVSCEATLECGHHCGGTCGTCFQGRLHAACRTLCQRILVCGHLCSATCCEVCPPCGESCARSCSHSKCQKKCGEPCVPCLEPCEWKCLPGCKEALQCRRRCGETCQRPRCSQPCRKKLKCDHRCRGLHCEKCPGKSGCPGCDESLTDIFFGTEDEPGALFYTLPDCKHTFEVTGLDKYMGSSPEECSIGAKTCPKCKVPIATATRYWDLIQTAHEGIDEVKKKILRGHSDAKQKLPELIRKLWNMRCLHSQDSFKSGLDTAKLKLFDRWLHGGRTLETVNQCVTVENQLNFYSSLEKLNAKVSNLLCLDVAEGDQQEEKTACARRLQRSVKRLAEWALEPRLQLSQQSIRQFQAEFRRLQLVADFLRLWDSLLTSYRDTATPEDLQGVRSRLQQLDVKAGSGPSDDKLADARKRLDDLLKTFPPTGLGVSQEERLEIVRAMGFAQKGHWFKCPRGHVYAIGDCGGAMQTSSCPECGAAIGGGSHRLLEDNALAPEMDGARFSAWSEQANLENYLDL